jgi:hypothetical protein
MPCIIADGVTINVFTCVYNRQVTGKSWASDWQVTGKIWVSNR